MKTLPITLIFLMAMPAAAHAQWTLGQCCDYALSHNISVKQRENAREQRLMQLSTARHAMLPDLSGSASQNFSFGRGLTAENTYTNTNTSSTSFSLGTSVPLFTGFQITNNIRLSQLNLEAATQDLEKARNDVSMQVAQAYVQVLYDREICLVSRRQTEIDSAQAARLQAMFDIGRTSQAELSQQQATLAQSRLTATQAEGNLRLSLLALTQLLELPSPEGFDVVAPDATAADADFLPASPDIIYADAVGVRPEVRAEQLRLQSAESSVRIARAGLFPQLSFSAGLGSNYYKTSGFAADGFGKQLSNNFSQYLGFNLSIPLFNRFQTRNSIRSALLERQSQALAVEQVKKTLYKEIQQVFYNTVTARARLASCRQARESSADAFRLVTARYETGKATSTEFNEAKAAYLKSESDLVQARYELLYQRALVMFYRGLPLSF